MPKILLGLGATCLLVAAVIFLAVAWSWLGIGGRTAVLVATTAAAGAVGTLLARRGLRVAAEALTTVALGLGVLDLVGADRAGWLGDLSTEALTRLVGLALLGAGLALTVPRHRLVVPQLVAPSGMVLALATVDWSSVTVRAVDLVGPVSVLSLSGLVVVGRRLGAEVLAWAGGALAAGAWCAAGLWSLAEAVAHPDARALWVEGHGWELAVLSLLALLVWGVAWHEPLAREGAATVVVCALTLLAVLPLLEGTRTEVTLVALAVTLAWSLVAAVTPPAWYVVPRVPLAVAALAATASALVLAGLAVVGVASAGEPFTRGVGARVAPPDVPLHPLLLLATAATLAVAALLATPRTRATAPVSAAVVGLAGLLTLGLHAVPLWVVVAVLLALGVGLLGLALRTGRGVAAAGASACALPAVAAALPSAVLTTAALAVVVVALAVALVRGGFALAAEGAGLGLPAAVAGLLWSVGEVAGVDPALRAAPVLLVLGLLAVLRARPEVEVGATTAGLVAAVAALPHADDLSVWLAVHLTLAGALVVTSSLVHPSRRVLAWPGGALLAAATWVRLWDLQVVDPEPYTLPTAAALLVVGLVRLHRSADTASATALGPGLALATVPSLLWVLGDPLSLRAGVLGLACLLVLLAGVQLRWHAPVVVGAVVGGTVVLRELAPYAVQTPQWVLIGLAGTVLVACGVTWESRMRDLQQAASYLGRLR